MENFCRRTESPVGETFPSVTVFPENCFLLWFHGTPPRSLIALRDWFSRSSTVYWRVTDGQLDTYGAICICLAMRRVLKLSDFQPISFYISEACKRHFQGTLTVATNGDGDMWPSKVI